MILTLDGERLDEPVSAQDTLQAVIDRLQQHRLGDRLVVSVVCDGTPLLDEELSRKLAQPLGETGQIDLTSADRYELVASALREMAAQLAVVGTQQAEAAGHIQDGKIAEAMTGFTTFLDAWQMCQRALLECSNLLGEDLTARRCDSVPVREHLDNLADKLRELRDAFEARDAVLLSDLIQYELPQTCQSWQTILNQLADAVAADTAAPVPAEGDRPCRVAE